MSMIAFRAYRFSSGTSNTVIGFLGKVEVWNVARKKMAIAVIPARYAATRLPGKPLVSLAGKAMIERVWERTRRAKRISRAITATDDDRTLHAAAGLGAGAVMTRSEHRPGTERVAEVAVSSARAGEEIFVNVQGDE